jgi:hypothetical protein
MTTVSGEPLKLLSVRPASRRGSTQVAAAEVLLLGLMRLELAVHRRDGLVWAALPKGCRWCSQRIASRFNRRLFGLIEAECPGLLAEGQRHIDRGPLLQRLRDNPSSQPAMKRGYQHGKG